MSDHAPSLAELDIEVSSLKPPDRDFLRALAENDGEADTSTLRSDSGLKRQQVHHRYDSLAERGLIEVERVGTDHDGRRSNVARLTDLGKRAIEAGLIDSVEDPNANIEDLNRRLDALNQRLTEHERRFSRLVRHVDDNVATAPGEVFTDSQLRIIRREIDDYNDFYNEAVFDIWEWFLPLVLEEMGLEVDYNSDQMKLDDSAREQILELSERESPSLTERVERLEEQIEAREQGLQDTASQSDERIQSREDDTPGENSDVGGDLPSNSLDDSNR